MKKNIKLIIIVLLFLVLFSMGVVGIVISNNIKNSNKMESGTDTNGSELLESNQNISGSTSTKSTTITDEDEIHQVIVKEEKILQKALDKLSETEKDISVYFYELCHISNSYYYLSDIGIVKYNIDDNSVKQLLNEDEISIPKCDPKYSKIYYDFSVYDEKTESSTIKALYSYDLKTNKTTKIANLGINIKGYNSWSGESCRMFLNNKYVYIIYDSNSQTLFEYKLRSGKKSVIAENVTKFTYGAACCGETLSVNAVYYQIGNQGLYKFDSNGSKLIYSYDKTINYFTDDIKNITFNIACGEPTKVELIEVLINPFTYNEDTGHYAEGYIAIDSDGKELSTYSIAKEYINSHSCGVK